MGELENIKIKKINHVGIPINDRKASFSLYMDFLGLKVIPSMVDEKHVIWSRTSDGTMVHLIEPQEGPGHEMPSFHVAFEVENFDETVEILRKSKYEITNGPNTRHDGQKAVYIQDLDGNTLEFTTHNNINHSNRIVDEWGYTKSS
ncbi:MAG: VOC family protein [Chloroflexota bacterium]|nr:VOC family protein [Chloroflexota bacterium]